MDSGTGDRGVSEVMGFILVFGMLVIAFTVYQGIVVPDQNRQVEFQHNQEVQGQLQDLRNAIVNTAATGSGQAVSVTLGATYPERTIAQNLGVSGGAISTVPLDAAGIRIDNVEALDEETNHYVDANGQLGPYPTKSVRYVPVYSFYSDAPDTVYENSLAFNRFDATNLTLTDQLVIEDDRITLIAVNGSLSQNGRDTVSIDTGAISTSPTGISVRNTTGDRITITVPTRLTASKWQEILADEMGSGGKVEQIADVPGEEAVAIELQQGTYELRMAKIGLGSATTDEPPAYITDVEGDDVSVPEGGSQRLVVEVRDRFNNPVGNVTVTPGTPAEGSISPGMAITDSAGRATFVYDAPDDVSGTLPLGFTVSYDGDGTNNESVAFDIRVLDTDGSGGGTGGDDGGDVDEVNPGQSGTIILDDQSSIFGGGDDDVTLTFRNTTGKAVSITEARISFYFDGDPGGGFFSGDDPTEVDLYSNEQGVSTSEATTLEFGDDFVSLSTQIPLDPTASDSSDTTVLNLAFDEDVEDDDFYVLSLKFSNGDTYTYFVSHP